MTVSEYLRILKFAVKRPSTLVFLFSSFMTIEAMNAQRETCQQAVGWLPILTCYFNAPTIFALLALVTGLLTYFHLRRQEDDVNSSGPNNKR